MGKEATLCVSEVKHTQKIEVINSSSDPHSWWLMSSTCMEKTKQKKPLKSSKMGLIQKLELKLLWRGSEYTERVTSATELADL